MKANKIKMYLDMYYNAEIPKILERETEDEKRNLKEKIKKLIKMQSDIKNSLEVGNTEFYKEKIEKMIEEIDKL